MAQILSKVLSKVLAYGTAIILLSYTPGIGDSDFLSHFIAAGTAQAVIGLCKRTDDLDTPEAVGYAADMKGLDTTKRRLETLKDKIDKLEEQKNRRWTWMWADTKSGTQKE